MIASKRIAAVQGARTTAVPLADGVPTGPARLKLTLTDRAGNERGILRRVRVPKSTA